MPRRYSRTLPALAYACKPPYYLPPSRGILSISSISRAVVVPRRRFFITVAVAAVVHPLSETDRDVGGGEALSSSLAVPPPSPRPPETMSHPFAVTRCFRMIMRQLADETRESPGATTGDGCTAV